MARWRPSGMRVSDEERYDATGRIREAAAEGRLGPEELEARIQAAYRATTYGELRALTKDLPRQRRQRTPVRPEPRMVAPEDIQRHDKTTAVLWSASRQGVWEIGAEHRAVAIMGAVTLDLREAQFAAPAVTIHTEAALGSIDIVVNRWTRVELDGTTVVGDYSESKGRVDAQIGPDSPLVRVVGSAYAGSVNVRRRRMPGELRNRLRFW